MACERRPGLLESNFAIPLFDHLGQTQEFCCPFSAADTPSSLLVDTSIMNKSQSRRCMQDMPWISRHTSQQACLQLDCWHLNGS
jgi:hypothetical protein